MKSKKPQHLLKQHRLRIRKWVERYLSKRKILNEQDYMEGCSGMAQAFVNDPEMVTDGCRSESELNISWAEGLTLFDICTIYENDPYGVIYVPLWGEEADISEFSYVIEFPDDTNSCTCILNPELCSEVVEGCTDPEAENYDSNATQNDGSCVYASGCTDDGNQSIYDWGSDYDSPFPGTAALNYDENAITDDGSCEYAGCMDPGASNYDETLNIVQDDGSCEYEGCMDDSYLEYNPSATIDDGSCLTPIVEGCTDNNYVEYNQAANTDDGSCLTLIVYGCTND